MIYYNVEVVQEYERAVIFRLGRLVRGGAKVFIKDICVQYSTVLYSAVQYSTLN